MTPDRMTALMHQIRERCAFLPSGRMPDYAAHDELMAMLHREAVSATPAQREELEREVRRRCGT